MNPFDRALTNVNATLKRAAGVTIVIKRGELRSDPLKGIAGQSTADQYEDVGHMISAARRQAWLIDPADYVLAGEAVEPDESHTIEQFDVEPDDWDDTLEPVRRFDVTSPVQGQPAWRYTDGAQTLYRVECLAT